MIINTDLLVPMTDANQNFSKVVRIVDEYGMAVILKNNKPRYIVVDFDEYDQIKPTDKLREEKDAEAAELLIKKNLEAFKELVK